MRACARANCAAFTCPHCGIPSAPPPSTDPSHRGDRSPRSPEATRTPSGSSTRGRFVSGVRRGSTTRSNAIASRSRSIRALLARGRESRAGAWTRCTLMLRCGRRRMQSHTHWRLRRGANAQVPRTVHSGVGFIAHPVRAALPWRMPRARNGVCASGRKLRGRAAAHAVGHRFESGSSTTG